MRTPYAENGTQSQHISNNMNNYRRYAEGMLESSGWVNFELSTFSLKFDQVLHQDVIRLLDFMLGCEHCDQEHHFILLNCFSVVKVLLRCINHFSTFCFLMVLISKFLYTNFPTTCVQYAHPSKSRTTVGILLHHYHRVNSLNLKFDLHFYSSITVVWKMFMYGFVWFTESCKQ